MATYLSSAKALSTSRSRQDRLRELERERQLYSNQHQQVPRSYAASAARGSSYQLPIRTAPNPLSRKTLLPQNGPDSTSPSLQTLSSSTTPYTFTSTNAVASERYMSMPSQSSINTQTQRPPTPTTKRFASNVRSTSSLSQDRYQDASTVGSRDDTGYTSAGEPGTGASRGRTRVTRDGKHVFTTGALAGTGLSSSTLGTSSTSAPRVPFSSRSASRKNISTSTTGLLNTAPVERRVWDRNADRAVSTEWDDDASGSGLHGGREQVEDDDDSPELQEKHRRNSLGTARSRSSQNRGRASPLEKRPTNGVADSWEALPRESSSRGIQYQESPKSLQLQLEKERARCVQLESDYYALLRDYETIKERHDREVKIMEDRGTSESRNLQQAMVAKAEESAALNRRLRSTLQKHTAEGNLWAERMETVQTEMERIQNLIRESEERTRSLQERLAAREIELKQANQAVREKEAQLQEEKEAGTRLAGQVLQLEHYLSQRDKDLHQLRETVESRNLELDALAPFKSLAEDRGHELERLQKRERQLRSELEEVLSRERAAREELEQCTLRERKLAHDRDRLTARETTHIAELEHLRLAESKLSADLKETSARLVAASEEISKLLSEQRRLVRDLQSAHHDLKSLRASYAEVREKHSVSEEARKALELRLENLAIDYTHSEAQFRHVTEELNTARSTITELNSDLSKARCEVEEEQRKSAEARVLHKEKISQIQERVAGLAQKLKEAEEEMEVAKSTERELKDAVRQKEEERDSMARKLSDVNAALQREKDARANDKQRKKEELLLVQEKFVAARSAMDSELESLRAALTAKTTALSTQTTQLSALRSEFSQTLQAREAQLRSIESQASHYQNLLTQKDQEVQLMGLKLQNAGEQVRRLEKELHMYRSANSGNGKGWTGQHNQTLSRPVPSNASDNHPITNSVSGLTRRLREQVASLIDDQSSEKSQTAAVSRGNHHTPSSPPPPPTSSANLFSNPPQPSTLPGASSALSSQDVSQPPPATTEENEFRASNSYVARPGSPAVFGYQSSRQSVDPGTTAKGDTNQRSASHRSLLSEPTSRKWTRASSGNTFGNAFADKVGEGEVGNVDRDEERERRFSELAGTGLAAWEDSTRASHRNSLQGGLGI